MREVFVIGVGMTRFGRHLDATSQELTQQSVRQAIDDAGVTPVDIDTAYYATVMQSFLWGEHSIPGEYALRPLGITGAQVMRVEAACASSTVAFQQATNMVAAGMSEVALVVGTEKLFSEDRAKRFAAFLQPMDVAEVERYREHTADIVAPIPAGAPTDVKNVMMEFYALQARLHMATFGTTVEQIAAVAAKDHGHSTLNPLAQYQNAMTSEEVLAAPTVAWPLTVPMCAPISDGSAAVILCSRAALSRFPKNIPIRILAVASRSGSEREPAAYDQHVTRHAAKTAYERAGVEPGDVDVAEVHDASSIGEMIQVEALGLCGLGQSGPDAAAGALSLGGRIPVNTSGGLVSKGHPMGATGLGQIHELVTQLRGRAGRRQVADARIAVAENSGGFFGVEDGLSCVTILGK